MAYELSFSPEFFSGDPMKEHGYGDAWPDPREKPCSLMEALVKAYRDPEERARIESYAPARIEGYVPASDFGLMAEDTWVHYWLDRARTIDTCGTLSVPVDVWLSADGWCRVDVYDDTATR